MTNEEIYENVMGHKPNKEFGIKGSFSWDDIDALMTAVIQQLEAEKAELLEALEKVKMGIFQMSFDQLELLYPKIASLIQKHRK